jgi:hypothetical protein
MVTYTPGTDPNIAKVFDAGTTDTGRPYFVIAADLLADAALER